MHLERVAAFRDDLCAEYPGVIGCGFPPVVSEWSQLGCAKMNDAGSRQSASSPKSPAPRERMICGGIDAGFSSHGSRWCFEN